MVFKRRDRLPWWKATLRAFWPNRGWGRALQYVKHRLRRLPDPPHRIARGVFAGVFVTFSPLFGLHFLFAASLAWIMRGNVLAALLSTFVGNPLTFVPIAALSIQTGHTILGAGGLDDHQMHHSLGITFVEAGRDLKNNVLAIFTDASADWSHLEIFFDEIFLPYLVGGLVPGAVFGLIGYYLSLPIFQAYQNRRKGVLAAKLAALKEKAAAKQDGKTKLLSRGKDEPRDGKAEQH
ncbi:MAG: DUF2062 domain-containing protein [Rhodobacteraceae bacterium]|nr:DUF2062 domain-containing protein [Paracoccaceae bacterium]